MDNYTYNKVRRTFGRQCIFSNANYKLCEINTDDGLKKQYKAVIEPPTASIQNVPQMSAVEVATENPNTQSSGLYHFEGGWPNDVDINDDAAKVKYLERFEFNDAYKNQLNAMCMKMEHKIAQNNAVNIFQEYFVEKSDYQSYRPKIDAISVFECPLKFESNVIMTHSTIAPRSNDKIAISYGILINGQMNSNQLGMPSFIWDLNHNLHPQLTLECIDSLSLSIVEYNPKDECIIAAGRNDGTVALYDSRIGGTPTTESLREESHLEYVSSLQWTMSKLNVEFFTCANDANFMTWDIRNLQKPCDKVELKLNQAGCCSSDYSFSMPTRFFIGTTNGLIISGNRRGNTYEERFAHTMKSFTGPVQTIERNPFIDKYALSVGDQSIRFWSEENRETPILQTKEYSHDLTCGVWNRNRCSNFLIGHDNGTVEMWDLLYDQYKSIASICNVNSRVQHLCSHTNGKLFISCHGNGDAHLLEIPEFLASHKVIEKAKLNDIFEREVKRETRFLTKLREEKMLIDSGNKGNDDSADADADDLKKLDPETLMNDCIADFDKITHKK